MKPLAPSIFFGLFAMLWIAPCWAQVQQVQVKLKTEKGIEIEAIDWALTDSGIWLVQSLIDQELRTQFVYVSEINSFHLHKRKMAKAWVMGFGVITLSLGTFLENFESPHDGLHWEYRPLTYYPRAKVWHKQFYIGGDAALYELQYREMLTLRSLIHQQHEPSMPVFPVLDF